LNTRCTLGLELGLLKFGNDLVCSCERSG
jgi:hypothetical protein